MDLDSRAHHPHNNTSFYAFGGSSISSDHHQVQVGFHRVAKGNDNNSQNLKLHQPGAGGHMMQGGIVVGKVLCDSNDGSLISFEDSYEATAAGGGGGGGQGYEHNDECLFGDDNCHLLLGVDDGRCDLTSSNVNNRSDDMLDWFYSSSDHAADDRLHKHPTKQDDESCMPPNKKRCTSNVTTKKSSKAKQPAASKDPQSIAAKNRRERISERLKILQELVPNGTKVDLVTMLEKAIGYVKFLQLQVKVLAADEFWPVHGGKAPELSQVKDAIDAILSSSQRSESD